MMNNFQRYPGFGSISPPSSTLTTPPNLNNLRRRSVDSLNLNYQIFQPFQPTQAPPQPQPANQDNFGGFFKYSDAQSNDQLLSLLSSAPSFTSAPDTTLVSGFQQPSGFSNSGYSNNMRRRSFGPMMSSLRPVHESRSSSPTFSFPTQPQQQQNQQHQQQQQQQQQLHQLQQLEQKLSLLNSASMLSKSSNSKLTRQLVGNCQAQSHQQQHVKLQLNMQQQQQQAQMSSRMRAFSTGSANSSFDFPMPSSSIGSSKTGSINNITTSSTTTLNSFDEKLATTGNMFQRRENWSILGRIPLPKQNTTHIRLEDEGPYGNDETRCFVLSHLSSLKIREIRCCVCDTILPIFDRFPLLDGTLFVSPVNYDSLSITKKRRGQASPLRHSLLSNIKSFGNESERSRSQSPSSSASSNSSVLTSIPATVSNKSQFIYAICLDCMNGSQPIEACSSARFDESKSLSSSSTPVASTLVSSSDINNNNNSNHEESDSTKTLTRVQSPPLSSSSSSSLTPSAPQSPHATCHTIKCKYCKQPWSGGSVLQIGTMYKYEIFAAFPCCQKRYACSNCSKPVINEPLPYFSAYSEERECPHCHTKDYHFIKPLTKLFDIPSKTRRSSLSLNPANA